MKKLLLLCSICLLVLSCDHEANDPAPDDTCKLSTSPLVKNLTYDNSGRVATLTTETYDGTMTVLVLSTFSYDAVGKLTKTVYTTLDGKPISEETYTYTDGRITRASFSGPNSPTGINNLSYDASGRLTRYTEEEGGQVQLAQTYTYNADGIITEQAVLSGQGDVLFRAVTKPVGSVKSPEQLLVKKGLPYLIPTNTPLSVAEGGVGTLTEFYSADPTGKLVLAGSQKVSVVKTNGQGYLTDYTFTDGDGNNPTTLTYTLTDCP